MHFNARACPLCKTESGFWESEKPAELIHPENGRDFYMAFQKVIPTTEAVRGFKGFQWRRGKRAVKVLECARCHYSFAPFVSHFRGQSELTLYHLLMKEVSLNAFQERLTKFMILKTQEYFQETNKGKEFANYVSVGSLPFRPENNQ